MAFHREGRHHEGSRIIRSKAKITRLKEGPAMRYTLTFMIVMSFLFIGSKPLYGQ